MPISGLIVTLQREANTDGNTVIALLRMKPDIEVGERTGQWVPIVTDTASDRASRALHGWIESIDGVAYVDVVAVGFDEPGQDHDETARRPSTSIPFPNDEP